MLAELNYLVCFAIADRLADIFMNRLITFVNLLYRDFLALQNLSASLFGRNVPKTKVLIYCICSNADPCVLVKNSHQK